ncbi:MAG TPA: NUDIX domain-containing protein [Mycobacterium sp.]|jgi:8-oxo-dGTP pyrophosphatase MutT (NUDIX family)|nr:NUDIX domain-containing protein [Mycobacterium sp.]
MSASDSRINEMRRPTQVAALDVFLVLLRRQHSEVLCALRGAVHFAAWQWGLPSGKVDAGEDPYAALIRETREEIGLALPPRDVHPAGVVHARFPGEGPRVGFVFVVDQDIAAHGEPRNTEPGKCDKIDWYPVDDLPAPFENYNRAALQLALGPGMLAMLERGVLVQPDT